MWKLYFKPQAIKQLRKLDYKNQVRLKQKLGFFVSQENPLLYARKLVNSKI